MVKMPLILRGAVLPRKTVVLGQTIAILRDAVRRQVLRP